MLNNIKKIGIFGGTLNPVHHGHLIVAEVVREKFQLDRVLFIPAGMPPHKTDGEVIAAFHRYNMVECAVETNPYFEASQIEIVRSGYSYTVDTLTALTGMYDKGAEFYFIIGADVVPEIITWKSFTKVFELCSFIAVLRPGHQREIFMEHIDDMKRLYNARIFTADAPLVDISSTNIRERVSAGASIKYLVPLCVEDYILKNGLYNGNK